MNNETSHSIDRVVPAVLKDRSVKAKVLIAGNVYEKPVKVGLIIDVDAITFANLAKKGRLELAVEAPEETEAEPTETGRNKKK